MGGGVKLGGEGQTIPNAGNIQYFEGLKELLVKTVPAVECRVTYHSRGTFYQQITQSCHFLSVNRLKFCTVGA